MCAPSHHHDVDDGEGKKGGMRLRHIAHDTREALSRPVSEILAVEADDAFERRHESQHGLEQRRLAATIGAEQAKHFARAQIEADAAADAAIAIAEAEILRRERHCQPRRAVASSQRKNGAPMNAVRMPIGTSIAAMVRASVSTASR